MIKGMIGSSVLLAALLVLGCATQKAFEGTYARWVDKPIADFEKVSGPLPVIGADGELRIYRYDLKRTPGPCSIFWYVDTRGIIVKWRHEGDCIMPAFE